MTRATAGLTRVVCTAVAWGVCGLAAAATLPYSEDVPIVGGSTALARALGIDPAPDRARFVAELARIVYDTPEGKSAQSDELLRRLSRHLDIVGRFQDSLAAVQPPGAGIVLSMAAGKNDRNRLRDFLDLLGLKLREKDRHFTVERTDSKQGAERVRLLADLGIDLAQLATRLNGGDTVRVGVPTELVPIPLPAAIWSTAVFQHPVGVSQLFAAILSDRRAALLCHGLAALDEPTLQFLAGHPDIVTRLYEHDAPAFAAFGDALRIRDGRVVTPGGADATAVWEAVVEREVTRPDRFVRELFDRGSGRVAYLYDIVTHLDPPRARFALGLWMPDRAARIDRFSALVSAESRANPEWDIRTHPFARPPDDLALLFAQIAVDASGAPAAPNSRRLWDRAFSGADLPDDPVGMLTDARAEGTVDAAWLVGALGDVPQVRAERIDQLGFGQRTFGASSARERPDVLVALRAVVRDRMLMLTLERMGVRAPGVYAAAARQAVRLSSLDANRAFVALAQFQGALALTARLVRVHAIDGARGEALAKSLVAVPLDQDGRYRGGVARWAAAALLPAIGGSVADADAGLLAALAGVEPAADAPAPITWEGRQYRVDLVGPERRRLAEVRGKLGGPPVVLGLEVERLATELSGPTSNLGDVKAAIAALQTLMTSIPAPPKRGTLVLPPGVDEPKSPYEILARAVQDLAKISKPKDLTKAGRVAEPLSALADDLVRRCADDVGVCARPRRSRGNIAAGRQRQPPSRFRSRRQGWRAACPNALDPAADRRRARGAVARQGVPARPRSRAGIAGAAAHDDRAGRPSAGVDGVRARHVLENRGAHESLRDARQGFRRDLGRDRPRSRPCRRTGRRSDDSGSGRRRDLDGRLAAPRRRVDAGRVARSRRVLLFARRLPDPRRRVGAIGRVGRRRRAVGRLFLRARSARRPLAAVRRAPGPGVLPTQVIDLNLHVALILHERHLPAALAKGVLAAATQDFIDDVQPTDDSDWLTLVRSAQAITSDRMDDYIAGLTASGPLVPWSETAGRR